MTHRLVLSDHELMMQVDGPHARDEKGKCYRVWSDYQEKAVTVLAMNKRQAVRKVAEYETRILGHQSPLSHYTALTFEGAEC